jgi:hypothetical protein
LIKLFFAPCYPLGPGLSLTEKGKARFMRQNNAVRVTFPRIFFSSTPQIDGMLTFFLPVFALLDAPATREHYYRW